MKNKLLFFFMLTLVSCTPVSIISSTITSETQALFSQYGEIIKDEGTFTFDLTQLGPSWRPFASAYGSPFGMLEIYVTLSGKLDKYFVSIANNHLQQSISEWRLDDLDIDDEKLSALEKRREQITSTLQELDINAEYSVLDVQIWSPQCCESRNPGISNSSITAIGARILTQLINKVGKPLGWYVVDVFIAPSEMSSWGEPERWYIRDIYPDGDTPLYWSYIYTYEIKSV
jgi:hypothetical protein